MADHSLLDGGESPEFVQDISQVLLSTIQRQINTALDLTTFSDIYLAIVSGNFPVVFSTLRSTVGLSMINSAISTLPSSKQ